MTLSLLTAALVALPALVAGQKPPFLSPTLFQPGLSSAKCIQPKGASQAVGTPIVLADCTGAAEQKIYWENDRVRVFSNSCFTTDANHTTGSPITLAACSSSDSNQSWYYNFFGGNQFKHNPSGKCLELNLGNLAAGTAVQLRACDKTNANQVWNTGYRSDATPAKSESGQKGTNQCGTGSSNSSMCQTAWINDVDDFCLWAPDVKGTVGDKEREVVSWCTKTGRGTRTIPNGSLKGVHFVKTKDYVQITGVGQFTSMNIPAGDSGGELDPHGPDGNGNPIGGLVYGNTFGKNLQYHEWTSFISEKEFCFRACVGKDAQKNCQHIYDVMGCYWNMPANYNSGVFESCDADDALPMGVYGTSTWKQGTSPTPAAHPVPSSSNCRKLATVSVGPVSSSSSPTTTTTTATTTTTTSKTTTTTSKTTTTTATTTTTSTGPAPTGKLVKSQANTSKCLTAASNADGAKAVVSDCTSSTGQLWTLSGTQLRVFGDKCLDVTGGVDAKGTKLQIWTCSNSNASQMWTLNASSDKHITWLNKDKSVDVTDGSFSNGNQLQIWQRSTTTNNQLWAFA